MDLKAALEADGFENVTVEQTPTRISVTCEGGPLGKLTNGKPARYVQALDLDEDVTVEYAEKAILEAAENTLLSRILGDHQAKFGIDSLKRKVDKRFAHRPPAERDLLKRRAHELAQQIHDNRPAMAR